MATRAGSKASSSLFWSLPVVFLAAVALRASLLVYGHFQDQWSALKYTDIDYFVFTDASRYVVRGSSPYMRDTYRYTPLLAWLLTPTAWGGWWFDFGKALFASSDIVAGWLIYTILRQDQKMSQPRALKFASLWLLNPMVAQISTRGSSEGLIAVMVMALLWATLKRQHALSGAILGLAVHFKIYPFIYGASIYWWLGGPSPVSRTKENGHVSPASRSSIKDLFSPSRITLVLWSAATFASLNAAMIYLYGMPFIEHTFLYHLVRSDHRHNFSPYNMLLYVNSSPTEMAQTNPETIAFIPQLFLSALAIPLTLSRLDLPSCMLAQTFAFVTFNKVCTSQYFLWYMVFLPFYLPGSSMINQPRVGVGALVLWILGQVIWLQQGYQLEFLGNSTFVPGLWLSSLFFFAVNTWILGIVVSDVRKNAASKVSEPGKKTN